MRIPDSYSKRVVSVGKVKKRGARSTVAAASVDHNRGGEDHESQTTYPEYIPYFS
ncbi:MAG: hypothetical protein V2B19_17945 [Pseudomonadota bacterium]